jgi:hypothetical protein
MGNWRVWFVILVVLAAGVWYVQHAKGRRVSASEPIFTAERDAVQKVQVTKRADDIELVNDGGKWRIAGNDSLVVRENRINDLFDRVLKTMRTTLMTENPDRWKTYMVSDSLGTRLEVTGWDGKTLGSWVFGSSQSDWSKNYIRTEGRPEVYLTNSSVIYNLNTLPTFWGEAPKPDTASVDLGDTMAPAPDPVQVDLK